MPCRNPYEAGYGVIQRNIFDKSPIFLARVPWSIKFTSCTKVRMGVITKKYFGMYKLAFS